MFGRWPEEYNSNPNPHPKKTIEQIWDDFNRYTYEELYELPAKRERLRFCAPLPPLHYRGKFIKGVCFSQGAHLLIEQFPDIKKLFFVCANSMCASYPWAHKADCFFTCYRNPERERYHKTKHPETKDIVWLPLQDSDFTNEKKMHPTWKVPNITIAELLRHIANPQKPFDVFCVSTPYPVKNLPTFARALKAYEQKYGRRLKVVYALGEENAVKLPDGSLEYSEVRAFGKFVLAEVDAILGDTKSYIDFRPYIHYDDLYKYYSSAKCGVLCSLFEGKNRFISECLCCNTPVIVFNDFNKFIRGETPIFFGNSGEYAPEFSPESLADTIHKVITNPTAYEPRKNYLQHSGRHNFINTFLREIPYYQENLPNFNINDPFKNKWLSKACRANYGVNLESFLYDKKWKISNVSGIDKIKDALQYYYNKFDIPWREIPEEQHESLEPPK